MASCAHIDSTYEGIMHISEDTKNIGENIRLHRIKSGLSQKELSQRLYKHFDLEIKPASLRNYEKGVERVSAVTLKAIADLTKARIEQFYEPANAGVLLNTPLKLHLIEAYSMIRCRSVQETLLHLVRKLEK